MRRLIARIKWKFKRLVCDLFGHRGGLQITNLDVYKDQLIIMTKGYGKHKCDRCKRKVELDSFEFYYKSSKWPEFNWNSTKVKSLTSTK